MGEDTFLASGWVLRASIAMQPRKWIVWGCWEYVSYVKVKRQEIQSQYAIGDGYINCQQLRLNEGGFKRGKYIMFSNAYSIEIEILN